MRALASLAALAGLAAILVSATGGRHRPIGWTGYAPLGKTVTCGPPSTTATLTFSSDGSVVGEGASQVVYRLAGTP